MENTDILNEMGSSFQRHAVTVEVPDDIQPSLTVLYKNAKVVRRHTTSMPIGLSVEMSTWRMLVMMGNMELLPGY